MSDTSLLGLLLTEMARAPELPIEPEVELAAGASIGRFQVVGGLVTNFPDVTQGNARLDVGAPVGETEAATPGRLRASATGRSVDEALLLPE